MTGTTGVELTYRDRTGKIRTEIVRPGDRDARVRELRAGGTRVVQDRAPNALTPAPEPRAPRKPKGDTPKGDTP